MKINISDAVLAEIGKIVVVHSLIDASLANIIGTIVSLRSRNELGHIVTAELAFRQRVAMLRSLLVFCLAEDHETVVEFDRIKKILHAADDQRNLVVHSLWGRSGESDPHIMIRMKTSAKEKKGLRTEVLRLTLEELQRITDQVGHAFGQISAFELQFQRREENMGANAKQGAAPNGGPPTPLGSSRVAEGPASVN